jgi:hypothetical protein
LRLTPITFAQAPRTSAKSSDSGLNIICYSDSK